MVEMALAKETGMKIVLKELQLELPMEEVNTPLGQALSLLLMRSNLSDEMTLQPVKEIAKQLEISPEAFRIWLFRDEELRKMAYLSDGTKAPSKSRASKYFRMADIRPIALKRKMRIVSIPKKESILSDS